MTQAEFDGLPGLLTRSQFLEATGLGAETVRALRLAGELEVFALPRATRQKAEGSRLRRKPKRCVKHKYFKREAARIGGWGI